MNWQVDLHGDKDDLEDLSKIFTSSDLQIIREGKGYILESSSFEGCKDSNAVKEIVDKLLKAINATKQIILDSSDVVTRGAIQYKDEGGNRAIFLETTISVKSSVRARLTVCKADGTIEESVPGKQMIKWIPLMESDERVRRVFDLMNHDFKSWNGFYKIIEVVQEDNFPPVLRKGEFYDDIDLLKQTAQSYEAVKTEARHAHQKFKKPDKEMKINEAKSLTKRIVEMWLNSKIK
ncbi:MAG: hypothetical protein QMC82_01185 [Methanolinea sp.]|jgi:hypothetical protein|nr:hypothetical protein [Methanolinea sp.]